MEEDIDLIADLLAGDRAAIDRVRGWIGSGLSRFRWRLRSELEDLEQEIVLALMESLAAGRFRRESSLETYVRSYARFKCIDRLRAAGRRNMVELGDDLVAVEASPLEQLAEQENAELLRRIVASLPPSCRELWGMIADGMSYREMSAATGLAEGAIRVRAHRCRQRALESRQRLLGGEPL